MVIPVRFAFQLAVAVLVFVVVVVVTAFVTKKIPKKSRMDQPRFSWWNCPDDGLHSDC